ncbi:putative GDP-L-fucose synthase 2 [Geobacter sp. OR-1]|nr:putative GDP-L-fucose synthase 2 [Geobacter sp. OR-1]
MDKAARIYVAGHTGLVGSAIVRKLESDGYHNLLLRTSNELDLRDQRGVAGFFPRGKA